VAFESGEIVQLQSEPDGYFAGRAELPPAPARYRFRLDGNKEYPDPGSRFQPDGPHGPSQVVDPASFGWTDSTWKGAKLDGQVIYELHVGTFTLEGTWQAAERELSDLANLGVTVIEVMPVNEFPGRHGWGYDGVDLFAPSRLYGAPDDMRRFIDHAHNLGLAVILDVVYNHLGPDGNYLKAFSKSYFTDRHKTDWGEAINFDGPDSGPVREYFIANAAYWIDEYHLDGLRFDATQNIYDSSSDHILAAIARRVRDVAMGRDLILVAESELQDVRLVRTPEEGGFGLDAIWNDDFHHSARVALTGCREAYYSDYTGTPAELVGACKHGFLYHGQRSSHQKKSRGTPTRGLPLKHFVTFLENHDQVSNSARGERLHMLTSRGRLRALTALTLLGPGTPMLFQGQEFASSSPFIFFADHNEGLAKQVREGRHRFLGQFESLRSPEAQACLPDPGGEATFNRCKLDFSERERNEEIYSLHVDLLQLRRTDPVFRLQGSSGLDAAVLAGSAFVLRFYGRDSEQRLLIVNLGATLHISVVSEPLLAPPDRPWKLLWSTQTPRYASGSTPPVLAEDGWHIPAESAVVLG
jgi:maltooligosyltrehalose trehalohydrolase